METKVKGWGNTLDKVARMELFERVTFKVKWE